MAKLKRLKPKLVDSAKPVSATNKSRKTSFKSKGKRKAESKTESEAEPDPPHKSFRFANGEPSKTKPLQKGCKSLNNSSHKKSHTPQSVRTLRNVSRQFEILFESPLGSNANAPGKPASKLDSSTESPSSPLTSAPPDVTATSWLFRIPSSSQIPRPTGSSSSLLAPRYLTREEEIVDNTSNRKQRSKPAPNLSSKASKIEHRSRTKHGETDEIVSDDNETCGERKRLFAVASLMEELPKPRTTLSEQISKMPSGPEEISTPCPTQRRMPRGHKNPISKKSAVRKASNQVKRDTFDDSSDSDCMIIPKDEAIRNIETSQSKSRNPVDKKKLEKKETKFDLYSLHDHGTMMAGARSTPITSGSASASCPSNSRKKKSYSMPSVLEKNDYIVDVTSQIDVSSVGGSTTSSNLWGLDSNDGLATNTEHDADNVEDSEGNPGTPHSSSSSDSQLSGSSESESEGSAFGKDLARKGRRNARAHPLDDSMNHVAVPITRPLSRRIAKKPPIQYAELPKELRQTERNRSAKEHAKTPAKKVVNPPKKSKGRKRGNRASESDEEEEDVVLKQVLSDPRPIFQPGPTRSTKCNFEIPSYFKTAAADIPWFRGCMKYYTKHPLEISKEVKPLATFQTGLRHFLECEEHKNQRPYIALAAKSFDLNQGLNWGASSSRQWDNVLSRGGEPASGKRKTGAEEEKDVKKLHKNVKKINKGVKGLHRKIDSSSQTLTKLESALDGVTTRLDEDSSS